jgi:hypothetical protein
MFNKRATAASKVLLMSVLLFGGTTLASAQILRDDPPGSAFQSEGIDEDNGVPPGGEHWSARRSYGSNQTTRAHASARAPRSAEPEYRERSSDYGSQWSSARGDHPNQCYYREGGGGQDLSGYWGPCQTH